jgi:hypothetical protein
MINENQGLKMNEKFEPGRSKLLTPIYQQSENYSRRMHSQEDQSKAGPLPASFT